MKDTITPISTDELLSLFQQLLQQSQQQNIWLEKIHQRIEQLEKEVQQTKQVVPIDTDTVTIEKDYPELSPIVSASELNSPEKRLAWWNSLEQQWQKAFNASFFQQGEICTTPTDNDLLLLLATPTLRIVGSQSMHPTISFELSNLTGLQQLTNLSSLFVTHHAITNLEGIEHLSQLNSLFCNANKLTDIRMVHYLSNLKTLFCNDNQISSLQPLQTLTQLEQVNCSHNQLASLQGLTKAHTAHLKSFVVLPNVKLKAKEIRRVEEELDIICRKR